MRSRLWLAWVLITGIGALIIPGKAHADIVYPSRLELIETEPGILEVTFVLPVIQGKVLNARPILPEAMGGGSSTALTRGLVSAGLTVNLLPAPSLLLEVKSESAADAQALLAEYSVPMTNQNLTQDEARAILEYLRQLAEGS